MNQENRDNLKTVSEYYLLASQNYINHLKEYNLDRDNFSKKVNVIYAEKYLINSEKALEKELAKE